MIIMIIIVVVVIPARVRNIHYQIREDDYLKLFDIASRAYWLRI